MPFTMNDMLSEDQLEDIEAKYNQENSSDSKDIDEELNHQSPSTVIVDNTLSADLDEKPKMQISNHQISELTESIVDDLIKNAFRPEPVNIEKE